MISAFWCGGVLEIILLLLFWITKRRFRRIRKSGRVHEIAYVANWVKFFKILLIFIPVLILLYFKNPFV